MSKTKRAKVVRAWAVCNAKGEVVDTGNSPDAAENLREDWRLAGLDDSLVIVKLTGTLPHKKGAKKSKLAQQEKAQ